MTYVCMPSLNAIDHASKKLNRSHSLHFSSIFNVSTNFFIFLLDGRTHSNSLHQGKGIRNWKFITLGLAAEMWTRKQYPTWTTRWMFVLRRRNDTDGKGELTPLVKLSCASERVGNLQEEVKWEKMSRYPPAQSKQPHCSHPDHTGSRPAFTCSFTF